MYKKITCPISKNLACGSIESFKSGDSSCTEEDLAQLCNKLCNGSSGFIINETPTMTVEDMTIVMFVLAKPKTT
jgi:hypothetical protein